MGSGGERVATAGGGRLRWGASRGPTKDRPAGHGQVSGSPPFPPPLSPMRDTEGMQPGNDRLIPAAAGAVDLSALRRPATTTGGGEQPSAPSAPGAVFEV